MRVPPTIVRIGACTAVAAALIQPALTHADPPAIPGPEAARTLLAELSVADEGSMDGYSREAFPHWSTSGECTTRETVLQRDGTNVETDAQCRATAGSWASPYDDQTVADADDVEIDHVVALAEGWRSGASAWSDDRREHFANDLDSPQLIAVTTASNRSKSDSDPSDWLPPNSGFHCTYAQTWVAVKSQWNLTLQQSEKEALAQTLQGC